MAKKSQGPRLDIEGLRALFLGLAIDQLQNAFYEVSLLDCPMSTTTFVYTAVDTTIAN